MRTSVVRDQSKASVRHGRRAPRPRHINSHAPFHCRPNRPLLSSNPGRPPPDYSRGLDGFLALPAHGLAGLVVEHCMQQQQQQQQQEGIGSVRFDSIRLRCDGRSVSQAVSEPTPNRSDQQTKQPIKQGCPQLPMAVGGRTWRLVVLVLVLQEGGGAAGQEHEQQGQGQGQQQAQAAVLAAGGEELHGLLGSVVVCRKKRREPCVVVMVMMMSWSCMDR